MTAQFKLRSGSAIDDGRARIASLVKKLLYVSVITAISVGSCYVVLSRLSPQYQAETTILIDSGDSRFGRISEELVAAQLQLLRSRDLARTVTDSLGLGRRPSIGSPLGDGSIVSDFLTGVGLQRDPTRIAPEERMLDLFAAHLSVSAANRAPVIAVAFTSRDPQLAADVVNAVAAEYIDLQQQASRTRSAESTISTP